MSSVRKQIRFHRSSRTVPLAETSPMSGCVSVMSDGSSPPLSNKDVHLKSVAARQLEQILSIINRQRIGSGCRPTENQAALPFNHIRQPGVPTLAEGHRKTTTGRELDACGCGLIESAKGLLFVRRNLVGDQGQNDGCESNCRSPKLVCRECPRRMWFEIFHTSGSILLWSGITGVLEVANEGVAGGGQCWWIYLFS